MTIEAEIAALTSATTNLLSVVNVSKEALDQKIVDAGDQVALAAGQVALAANQVTLATVQAGAAADSATAAAGSATTASTKAGEAEAARAAAVAAQNNAVAVVTGGTATLTPSAGKIPLADAQGKVAHGWVTDSDLVERTDIGTDPNQVPLNQYLGGMAFQDPDNVNIGGGILQGQVRRRAPLTKTAAFTVADNEHWFICNGTAAIPVTLPNPATNTGREIMLKTIAAFAVNSASSNVVPLIGGAAAASILPATSGKWATLVSDGTNWVVMQSN